MYKEFKFSKITKQRISKDNGLTHMVWLQSVVLPSMSTKLPQQMFWALLAKEKWNLTISYWISTTATLV